MRHLLGLFLIFIFVFVFSGCSSSTNSDTYNKDVLGRWILHQSIYTENYEGEVYIDDSGVYDPSLDNYFNAVILDVSDDKIITFENDQGLDYFSVTDQIDISGNSIDITNDEGFTFHFTFSVVGNMLVLTNSDDYRVVNTYWEKYIGPVPPASWVNPLPADGYESDNSYQNAKPISVGSELQIHTITIGDMDWVSFSAIANETYMLRVIGYMDNILTLYNTDGVSELEEDDDNDMGYDLPGNVESVIVWECGSSGVYYFKVAAYDHPYDGGYYAVDVTLTDFVPPFTKTAKTQTKNRDIKRFGLFNNHRK